MIRYILGAACGIAITALIFFLFFKREEHPPVEDISEVITPLIHIAPEIVPEVAIEEDPIIINHLEMQAGQTFGILLNDAGVGMAKIHAISDKLNIEYPLRSIRPGEKFNLWLRQEMVEVSALPVETSASEDEASLVSEDTTLTAPTETINAVATDSLPQARFEPVLHFVRLEIDRPTYVIDVTETKAGEIQVERREKELETRQNQAAGTIEYSLDQLGHKLGVPPNIMMETIKVLSFDVDFQRDIRKGSEFKTLYEGLYNTEGEKVKDGRLLYALLQVHGEDKELFFYEDSEGVIEYFNAEGQTAKKALLKTPINGARISSGFGLRRHPVLGYTKMHKGMDFAAKRGTPIFAAGRGKISFVGRRGGYGNYIKIKHSNAYSTAYAHMHRFAKGMRKGTTVKQGQVIGYVGSTGRSTGPHLHYEIHKNGKHINPAKVKIPSGRNLSGKELERFKEYIKEIRQRMEEMPVTLSVE